ncbi:MAG: aspartate-semialdehyde dehydrogenase [Bacteroidales bacterium]
MILAVVGATGLVGQMMLRVLEEQQIQLDKLIPAASARSVGKTVTFRGEQIPVVSVEEAIALKPHIALFSAGGKTSLQYAPLFAANGTYVIDNSSAWRRDPNVPLVVPEINLHAIAKHHHIIANPNCSTIQMVVAINPLYQKYGIKRLVISTYQSVSGTGVKGISQLENEMAGLPVTDPAYPHPIAMNVIPHGGDFEETGYTSEEVKLEFETRKIMEAPEIAITSTVVRVPVKGGHSIAVNIEFEKAFELQDVFELLNHCKGIIVVDDPSRNNYPMPLYVENHDEVFVGRIRRDFSVKNGLNLWVVADNLRKGAATNAVQIADFLIKSQMIS